MKRRFVGVFYEPRGVMPRIELALPLQVLRHSHEEVLQLIREFLAAEQ